MRMHVFSVDLRWPRRLLRWAISWRQIGSIARRRSTLRLHSCSRRRAHMWLYRRALRKRICYRTCFPPYFAFRTWGMNLWHGMDLLLLRLLLLLLVVVLLVLLLLLGHLMLLKLTQHLSEMFIKPFSSNALESTSSKHDRYHLWRYSHLMSLPQKLQLQLLEIHSRLFLFRPLFFCLQSVLLDL